MKPVANFVSNSVLSQSDDLPFLANENLKREARRRDALMAFFFAFANLALFNITRRLQNITPSVLYGATITVYATTILSLVFMIAFCVLAARSMALRRTILINLLFSALLVLPRILLQILPITFKWAGWESVFSSPLFHFYAGVIRYPEVGGLALMWFATSIGVLLSRMIREFKILLPSAVALAAVDVYVVFGGGLVTQAQSGQNPIAQMAMRSLTIPLPVAPKAMATGMAPLALAVGFADFLFIALFFACFRKFDIPSRKTFYFLLLTLTGYMLVVAMTGMALPALVPIALVVIGMNLRRFNFTKDEKQAMGIAGVIIVVLLVIIAWRSKH